MKLLVTVVAVCILALAVVAWRLATAHVGATAVHDDRGAAPPSVSPSQATPVAGSVLTPSEAPPTEERQTNAASVAAAPLEQPPASPQAASQPAVHWAANSQRSLAQRRLAAARQILADDPYHPTALRDQDAALRDLGQWSAAADTLARLVELEPENAALRFEHAESLLQAERWASAIAALRMVVGRAPDHAPAWRSLATAQQALGHLRDARRSWTRLLELAPGDPAAHAHRGEVLLALHEWEAAAADFQQVLNTDADAPAAALGLSQALAPLGRDQEARTYVLDVLERHPRHVPAMNRMAELAWSAYQLDPIGNREQLDATIAWCRRSLEIDPHQPRLQALLEAASNRARSASERDE